MITRTLGLVPLSAGDVVAGKYRIERPLGEGGMGRVYVATHGVLRKQVALKVMVERFRVSPDAVERFFREAVAASKVDHPAIAQVFDAGVHEDSPFMVMELLQGEDLDQRLTRDGRLSVEETLRMARPILSALEAAHRAGVVHRDIKPPNIFLARRPDGVITPKLLDFGIAKHINDPNFDSLTQSGSVLGTPLYLAPEQARADTDVDHRADIYSIGVTLYHCLSGRTPHEAATFAELIGKMFSEPPRDLSELAPHVPPQICSWVQRCLTRDPQFRPQSAQALLDGLNSADLEAGHAHTPQAFAKTHLPEPVASGTMDVVVAEPVPTLEVESEEGETKTTAFEWGSQASPVPEVARSAPVTPPTRHIPIDYATPTGEEAPISKRPVVPAATPAPAAHGSPAPPPGASAWSVAGMERGLDSEDAAPKKSSGAIVLVFITLFVVSAAVLGTWLFIGGGSTQVGEWMSALSGAEPAEPPITNPPTHVAVVDAGAPMEPSQAVPDTGATTNIADAGSAATAGDDVDDAAVAMAPSPGEADPPDEPPARELEDKGRIEVVANPPGVCFIDGRRIGQTPVAEMVPAGQHVVLVTTAGGGRSARRVVVEAGGTHSVVIGTPEPAPTNVERPGLGPGARRTVMQMLRQSSGWAGCRARSGGQRVGHIQFRIAADGRAIDLRLAPRPGQQGHLACYAAILRRTRLPGSAQGGPYRLAFPR